MEVLSGFGKRVVFIRAAINRPWPSVFLGCTSVLGIYDMLGSQLVPPAFAKLPKTWEMIAGLLDMLPDMSPGAWAVLLGLMTAGIVLEYGFRAGNRHSIATASLVSAGTSNPAHKVEAKKPRYAAPSDSTEERIPAGRIMVPDNITPDYLRGFYDQHIEVQADKLAEIYIGKWIRVSGPMRNIWEDEDGMLAFISDSNNMDILMRFDMKWKDRLSVLSKKTTITVLGQIKRIQASHLSLHNCELLEIPF
jgi:hypothetical protein